MGLDPQSAVQAGVPFAPTPLVGDRDPVAARTHLWPGFTARAVLPVVLVPVLATVLTVPQRASAVLTCPTVAGDGTVSPTIRSGDDVTGCDLTDANLVGSNLTGVDFTNANLTNANLTNANLTDATLTGANLNYANIENAVLWGVRSGGISAESLAFS